MKELIRSNETMQQFSNVERLTTPLSGVEVKLSLTPAPFPPTLGREGDIFMPEPGQSEVQKPKIPQPRRIAEKAELTPTPKELWDKWERDYLEKQGRPTLTFEEMQIKKAGIEARRPPYVGGAQDEQPPETPSMFNLLDFGAEQRVQDLARLANTLQMPYDARLLTDLYQRVNRLLDTQGELTTPEARNQAVQMSTRLSELLADIGRTETREARRYGSFYGERKLSPQEIQVIRTGETRARDPATGEERDATPEEAGDEVDRIFNRMFDRVDVSPKVQFGTAFGTAGQIEFEEFRRTLNEAVADEERTLIQDQRDRAERLVRRYAEEFELREIAHNANYAVVVNAGTEELANFVQRFSDSMGDLAFRKDGVVEAFHFHEQALLKIREENGGYLPPYEATGEHGREIKGRLEELLKKYMDTRFPDMPKWKKDRAISLARGMGVIGGKTIEIAASSRLPEERGQPVGPRIGSMYAQKIIEGIAPFRHLIYKYDIRDFRDRVFAYLLDRDKGKPWRKEELADFDTAQRVDIINGLVDDKEERFLSVLNPWRVGGVLSRTTWRIGRDPSVGALGDFVRKGRAPMITRFKGEHNIAEDVDLSKKRDEIDYEKKFLSAEERERGRRVSSEEVEAINAFLEANPGSDFAERDPRIRKINDYFNDYKNWVGTGVQIELLRGELLSPERKRILEEAVRNNHGEARTRAIYALNRAKNDDPQAEEDIRGVLGKIARIQPLKLFFNLKGSVTNPGLQERVLENLASQGITREQLYGDPNDPNTPGDLDVLVVLQEKAVHDALYEYDQENRLRLRENIQEVPLNFDDPEIVGDPARAERLRRFVKAVQFEFTQPQVSLYGRSRLDRFVDDLRNKEWRLPFNFGTDDAPLREYRFSKAGGNAFSRRWNDMVAASKATEATIGLMDGLNSFKTQEPAVAAIKQIYNPLANIDESLAKDRSMAVAEGVMKFYRKDWYARLPFGVGTLFNITGRHSFAELAYGKGQMSWDEVDLNGFTRLLRDQVPITLEQQHELQGKAGGTRTQTAEAYARLLIPIIALALTYYVLKESAEVATERK